MSIRYRWLSEAPHHEQQLAQWHVAEWSKLIQGFNVAAMIEEFASHDGGLKIPTTLLALDGERLLGSVSLLENDHDDIRAYSPWLASLYVREDQRGRGLGSTLVRRCEDMARQLGIERLYLYTAGQEAFYRKIGWVDVATVPMRRACATVMATEPRLLTDA